MDRQTATAGADATFEQRPPRRVAIDRVANVALLALVFAVLLFQLFGWPLLLAYVGVAWWIVAPVTMLLVVLSPTHWGLIHEAIHGQLLPRHRWNEAVGRLLAIAFMLPFDAVRFGHLMHHRFTREPYDRPDVFDDATGHTSSTSSTWRAVSYYVRLLGGLYLAEVMLPILAYLPADVACRLVSRSVGAEGPVGTDVQRLFVAFAGDPARRARIRRDAALSLALHAFAFHLYGEWWPLLLATMYLRGLWLSLADNLPHYDVPLDVSGRARNFRVPRFWQAVLMNHHLHQLHHRYPTLPWTALPALADDHAATPPGTAAHTHYFRAALRQFRRSGRVG
ncbi:fatty acid desaturase family protein [Paraburkholderia sp.]|uniref:fatty acid desaturase family protein n=1 Tax=Paraburkholderia sp. TaxID=1926495 RepID=UPI003D6E4C62